MPCQFVTVEGNCVGRGGALVAQPVINNAPNKTNNALRQCRSFIWFVFIIFAFRFLTPLERAPPDNSTQCKISTRSTLLPTLAALLEGFQSGGIPFKERHQMSKHRQHVRAEIMFDGDFPTVRLASRPVTVSRPVASAYYSEPRSSGFFRYCAGKETIGSGNCASALRRPTTRT
jgi:hypothetical protein